MWIDRLIGERIRARREVFGVSVETVAERTGIGLSVLLGYESGQKRMQSRDLNRIAQALDLTPEHLLAGEDQKPGPGIPRVSMLRDTVRIRFPQ